MVYIYRCRRCGDIEVKQRITDPPLTRCPNCEGRVKRVIQPIAFLFREKSDASGK